MYFLKTSDDITGIMKHWKSRIIILVSRFGIAQVWMYLHASLIDNGAPRRHWSVYYATVSCNVAYIRHHVVIMVTDVRGHHLCITSLMSLASYICL